MDFLLAADFFIHGTPHLISYPEVAGIRLPRACQWASHSVGPALRVGPGNRASIEVPVLGHPMPRGSWAAWAREPQALSHVAATTCRARVAAWKPRRGCPKVARNGTFPADFEHLYTTMSWRFWVCGAQDKLTDNRPTRQAVYHWLSWSWILAGFAPGSGLTQSRAVRGDKPWVVGGWGRAGIGSEPPEA
jgi:hypothetical protein